MVNYFFCYSNRKEYTHLVDLLHSNSIAKPSLLVGDDRLFCYFNRAYPSVAITEKSLYLELENTQRIGLNSKLHTFFQSNEYLIAKDKVLKMMDRVDHIGAFNRLDRESLLYRLFLYWEDKLEKLNPDVLIFCDAPHTHESHSLFVLARYFDIPVLLIRQWGILPCVYGTIFTGCREIFINRDEEFEIDNEFISKIGFYFDHLKNESGGNCVPLYMKNQRYGSTFIGRMYLLVSTTLYRLKQSYLSPWRLLLFSGPRFLFVKFATAAAKPIMLISDFLFVWLRRFDPKNPFGFSRLRKSNVIKRRRKRLLNYYRDSLDKNGKIFFPEAKYVYFALHYEPEASTNPEGGVYYDQFVALAALRAWLPEDIKILIKEHPSQFYRRGAFGYLGRSPFFYDAINDLDGVHLVPVDQDSHSLIKSSLFVATITGTVALEAVAFGKKSLYFGDPWYRGAPNTFKWSADLDYNLLSADIDYGELALEEMKLFLSGLYKKQAYPFMLNDSGFATYPFYEDVAYRRDELTALYTLTTKALRVPLRIL